MNYSLFSAVSVWINFWMAKPAFGHCVPSGNLVLNFLASPSVLLWLACVASVSVRLRSKERGTRVKDCAKNDVIERAGSCFISRAAKTENPVPRSFFAPKPNGNACYAGYFMVRGGRLCKRAALLEPIFPHSFS